MATAHPPPSQIKPSRSRLILRLLLAMVALYLLTGLCYTGVSLYLYNVRNWDVYGGFSLPPLFCCGGFLFDLFLWPVYLWADWINRVGIFAYWPA
jgi:hypothetical protein